MRYFTADTHFGHQKLIEHEARPCKTATEMDELLITNWNAIVSKRDIIYHLGDFSWRGPTYAKKILKRLNGQIHLIKGNHDKLDIEMKSMFASVSEVKRIKVNGVKIMLCHYALRT